MPSPLPENILSQAEKLCQQRQVRLTPLRYQVLNLMAKHNSTISAYDLLDLLRVIEPHAKPPTVYRALDFLLEQGFIHKLESNNTYIVCHHFEEPGHTAVMLICYHCGIVSEQEATGVEAILQMLSQEANFSLRHYVIEAHGYCSNCCDPEQKDLKKS